MGTDISRNSFRPEMHYTSVRLQQGRVQLDADFNEQTDILNHQEQSSNIDTLGGDGVPLGSRGFRIEPVNNGTELQIQAGRLYLDGLLVQNELDVSYSQQPHLPEILLPDEDGVYLAFLEIRQRSISAIDDPLIRESALNLETAAREQLIWQVQLCRTGEPQDRGSYNSRSTGPAWEELNQRFHGRLRARSQPGEAVNPCEPGVRGGYSLPENKLYRIEIHEGGTAGIATFKWSRDNAALVTEWLGQEEDRLMVRKIGRDRVLQFTPGAWVEITDERLELKRLPGVFVRIVSVEGESLTVDIDRANYAPATLIELGLVPEDLPRLDISDFNRGARKIRLWDVPGGTGTLPTPIAGEWMEVEASIEIQFDPAGGDPNREYQTGDYWLMPARAAGRNIEWPCENGVPVASPPTGPRTRFARLAFLQRENGVWENFADCRRIFPTATDLFLSYSSGDGQQRGVDATATLSEPLCVRVSRGQIPVSDVSVLFQIRDVPANDDGGELVDLENPGNRGVNVTVLTNGDGLARIAWRLAPDSARPNQVVRALLTGPDDGALMWVDFNANLNLASGVSYDVAGGGDDASGLPEPTVQAALDTLFQAKVNRAGDTITGSLVVDQDVEIKGNLIVAGDVTAKDEEHIQGNVELGDDAAQDFVTVNAKLRGPRISPSEFGPLLVEGDGFVSDDLKIAGRLGVGFTELDPLPVGTLISTVGGLTVKADGLVGVANDAPAARLHVSSPDGATEPPLRVEAREQGVGGRIFFQEIEISNGMTDNLLDFQIRTTTDLAALVTAGHLRADCADLRFVDEDRVSPLPHWIESGKNTSAALIWIRVPLAPASGLRRIYMYYGNPLVAGSEAGRSVVLNGEITEVIAAWRLDNGSAVDDSGGAHNGALRSAPAQIPGRIASALRFDGLDDAVVVDHASELNIAASFSMAAWFNCEGPGTGTAADLHGSILGKEYTNNSRSYLLRVDHATQKITFDLFEPNNTAHNLASNNTIAYNTWYHVAAIYNKITGTALIYINGSLDSSFNIGSIDIQQTTVPLGIGCFLDSNDGSVLRGFFQGTLDEIRLYNIALSSTQVAALYTSRSEFSNDLPGIELLIRSANPEPTLQIGGEDTDAAIRPRTAIFVQASPGNVGIGTTEPGERLSVNGVVESMSGGFRFPDGTLQTTAGGATGAWTTLNGDVYANANVGVGTSTPRANLDVAGRLYTDELVLNGRRVELTWRSGYTSKIQAADNQADDRFGQTVAINGDTAIVGAQNEDTGAANAGAAYIFERVNGAWVQKQKLQALDKGTGDLFGRSVAISGETIIIGASSKSFTGAPAAGAVYIFERENGVWVEKQRLDPRDKATNDSFGISVAISGTTAMIGAHRKVTAGDNSGAVYVFKRIDGIWFQTQRLLTSDLAVDDLLGLPIAVSGNWAIFGTPNKAGVVIRSGAAYVFESVSAGVTDVWIERQKLVLDDAAHSDYFGISVCMQGDRAVIGAIGRANDNGTEGAAYVYQRENGVWTQKQKLTAIDDNVVLRFGNAVALSGPALVVGATGTFANGIQAGAAYIFEKENDTWVQKQKLQPHNIEANDSFGTSAAISGDAAIVGATGEDTGGSNAGAAYIFEGELRLRSLD